MNTLIKAFYNCSYRRYHSEERSDYEIDVYASSQKEAALILIASLMNSNFSDKDDAVFNAQIFLTHELGLDWTVEELLQSGLEIWSDAATCFVVHDIWKKEH